MKSFILSESGNTAIEYGMIASFTCLVFATIFISGVQENLNGTFNLLNNHI